MRVIASLVVRAFSLSLLIVVQLHADQFQLRQRKNQDTFDISYATVRVRRGSTVLFTARTDKYGRVTINVKQGSYEAEVDSAQGLKKVPMIVDGRPELKTIYVK